MDLWEDYYSVLQVHFDAQPEVIQSAYRRLCRMYHPDINPTYAAAEKIKRINRAYEVLGNAALRSAYHAEWKRRNQARNAMNQQSPGQAGAAREPIGTAEAENVIGDYFEHLQMRRFKEAYDLISGSDKKKISYMSFFEWQDSVSTIYEIGNFSTKLFKRHSSVGDLTNVNAEEYTVSVCEKNKNTNAVNEYSFTKIAVMEGKKWRVYLGYRDLAPIVKRFQFMLSSQEEAEILGHWEKFCEVTDLTVGLANRNGFKERFLPEKYRFERYGRQFSVCIFKVSMAERLSESTGYQKILRFIGFIIKKSIRTIDSAFYLGGDTFALLLSETGNTAAFGAAKRISNEIRHDIGSCFDLEIGVEAGICSYTGGDADEVIKSCENNLERSKGFFGGRIVAG